MDVRTYVRTRPRYVQVEVKAGWLMAAALCRRCGTLQRLAVNRGSSPFHCENHTLLKTFKRLLRASSTLSDSDEEGTNWSSTYPLPWVHSPLASQIYGAKEPSWNRFAGLFLIRRFARLHRHNFRISDFLLGVKDAIYALSDVLADRERHEELENFIEPSLCASMRCSLDALPTNARIGLEIESLRNLHLASVNAIIGSADEGDRHEINWLGQQVVTNQSKLESMMESGSKFTLSNARNIGEAASSTRLEFRLGVSFSTQERFAMSDENGLVLLGSEEMRQCFHLWRFSSLVAWETAEGYPFQWTVVDINNYMQADSQLL